MTILEWLTEAFTGGFTRTPLHIISSMVESAMTSEIKEYFRVGEYESIEARLSATGAGIIGANAINSDNRMSYSSLRRE